MTKSRLMDRPEDYERIGVKKGVVEPWEDGRREFGLIGSTEWWYFDGVMEDGTKVAFSFHVRSPLTPAREGDCPLLQMNLTEPDGRTVARYIDCSSEEFSFSKEGCDVKMGPHYVHGNLDEYQVHIDPVDGYGLDLTLKSHSSPWRPGAGYIVFGEEEKQFFTWLIVVPKGEMSGSVTFDGVTRQVNGEGYHDHQWTNTSPITLWNHWVWGRQHFEDYSLIIGDLTHSHLYGYKRYPLFVLQDKDGNIVFENSDTENFKYEVLEEMEKMLDKDHPAKQRYTFKHGGKTVEYTLTATKVLECDDRYHRLDEKLRAQLDQLDFYPTYARFLGRGELIFRENDTEIKRESELIYEMTYPGKSYKVF